MKFPDKVALLIIFAAVAAGSPACAEVRWGLLGGADMNRMTGEDWEDTIDNDSLDNGGFGGANLGFFLSFDFGETYSFRPGLRVLGAGGRASNDASSIRVESRILHIPLLVYYKYPLGPGKVLGAAGPSINVLLDSIKGDHVTPSGSSRFEEKDYDALFLGAVLGAGYEVPVSSAVLSLEVRYHTGFTKVIRDRDYYFTNISALIGFAFPLP